MVGSRPLGSLELGHQAQPLRNTRTIGRIGFAETTNLPQLNRLWHPCIAAVILSGELGRV
jgi:hypothetical protein